MLAAFLIGLFLVDIRGIQPASFCFSLPAENSRPGADHLPVPRHPPSPAAVQDPPGDAAGRSAFRSRRYSTVCSPWWWGGCWACRSGCARWWPGFTVGYLTYDLTHYATHHFPMRSGIGRYLKRYHMMHHYKTPDQRFGVSSPLWDIVYGTGGE